MKMLVHRLPMSSSLPFILSELKHHLRVDAAEEDDAVTKMGLAAAAELEHFAQIALLTQTIRVTIYDPPGRGDITLPIGPPVQDSTATVTFDGEPFTAFSLEAAYRPYLRLGTAACSWPHPTRITVDYQAGFGADAVNIPADLAEAIMDQAALHYDGRSPMNARDLTMSPHMARIGARYRGVSV